MSKRLRQNIPLLRVLRRATPKQANVLISKPNNRELVLCLCEIADNILAGTVKLSSRQKQILSNHKKTIRALANKSIKLSTKRRLLTRQKGGFFPAILTPALTVVAALLGQLL